jgi:hypothetical protein
MALASNNQIGITPLGLTVIPGRGQLDFIICRLKGINRHLFAFPPLMRSADKGRHAVNLRDGTPWIL